MAIQDIRNFVAVNDRIGTGGQPSEEQLRDVAADGYTTNINLGLLDPRYCLLDEAGISESLGLRYHHIPVQFDAPAVSDFEKFASAMDQSAGDRTFVHCAANYRVSAFVALYGELRLGWTRAQADAHIGQVWEPNDLWRTFIAECRRLFVDAHHHRPESDAGRALAPDRLCGGDGQPVRAQE